MSLNQCDDILIGGRNIAQHNATLPKVFQIAQDFGVTFNLEKGQFRVEELEFCGYWFTDRLKPMLDKVRVVKESRHSRMKPSEVSWADGLSAKIIPQYPSITEPWRQIIQTDVRFHWEAEEQNAFENLKASISRDDKMVNFNPNKPIIV